MSTYSRIKHFTDIEAYKIGREIRRRVYQLVKRLPPEEKYGLANQMRRAAISITANIAEGYGRFYLKETVKFCRISRGSMYEMQDHLITCSEEGFIPKDEGTEIYRLCESAIKAINGYMRFIKKNWVVKNGE